MSKKPAEPTDAEIAHRAYEISLTPDAGSADDNWHRAAAELRDEQASQTEDER